MRLAKQTGQLGLLLLIGMTGCSNLKQSEISVPIVQLDVNVTSIQAVQAQPNQNSVVHLKGRVENQVPLLEGQVYELRDATGTIWVLTKEAVRPGEEVLIRGRVRYQSIPVAGRELGEIYVEEQQRLENPPPETSLLMQR